MKKLLLLCLGMLTFVTIQANTPHPTNTCVSLTSNKAVTFIERGIRFRISLSGNFTYTILTNNQQKSTLKGSRNRRGFINRIGTIAIYYNSQNQFTRIGSVRMNYRNGYLSRIGSLVIRYDSNNRPAYKGRINSRSRYYSYTAPKYRQTRSTNHRTNQYSNSGSNHDYEHRKTRYNTKPYDYNTPFFYRSNFSRDYVRYKTDHHFIYYKAKRYGNAKYKKIKRRIKSASNKFKSAYKHTQRSRYNKVQTKYYTRRAHKIHSNTYNYYTSFFYN